MLCGMAFAKLDSRWCSERYNGNLVRYSMSLERSSVRTEKEYTYHPSGVSGALMGTGSFAVNRRQCQRHNAGCLVAANHFFDTYAQHPSQLFDGSLSLLDGSRTALTRPALTTSLTLNSLRIRSANSGARVPTMSNVDLRYFCKSKICRGISPGNRAGGSHQSTNEGHRGKMRARHAGQFVSVKSW